MRQKVHGTRLERLCHVLALKMHSFYTVCAYAVTCCSVVPLNASKTEKPDDLPFGSTVILLANLLQYLIESRIDERPISFREIFPLYFRIAHRWSQFRTTNNRDTWSSWRRLSMEKLRFRSIYPSSKSVVTKPCIYFWYRLQVFQTVSLTTLRLHTAMYFLNLFGEQVDI